LGEGLQLVRERLESGKRSEELMPLLNEMRAVIRRLQNAGDGVRRALDPGTGIFPSPFKYREQAVLAVPSDTPAPNVDASGHFAALARITMDLATTSNGGMFVLFTSHRDVRAMASELR